MMQDVERIRMLSEELSIAFNQSHEQTMRAIESICRAFEPLVFHRRRVSRYAHHVSPDRHALLAVRLREHEQQRDTEHYVAPALTWSAARKKWHRRKR